MKKLLFETNWMASQPVFYNEKTGLASHVINDVIDFTNLEFHPEGFNNYLDFGYSILEQTPVQDVKFLRHSSRIFQDETGKLEVEYLDDPIEQWLDYKLSENDVIDLIRERVQRWERSVKGEIVLPLSGGYDSRLLAWCIEDKSKVRTFTYGISENQSDSYEVVHARKLSEIFGFQWEQIPLGDFHQYIDDWDHLYGASTHAHGMYHIEFYNKILNIISGGNPFLSGIFGDVWAGSTFPPVISSHHEMINLGYTHGLNADINASRFSPSFELRKLFLQENREQIKSENWRVIIQIRLKIILISYLLRVPKLFGFSPWSPFLDIDVCMAMLNLPPERKQDRLWQKEFFQKVGLDLESMNLQASQKNTLDLQALRRIPVKPLDASLLGELIQPDYVMRINRNLLKVSPNKRDRVLSGLLNVRMVGGALRRLGFTDLPDMQLRAYNAYIVLLPIQKLLYKRNLG